jgi:antirestriction protein ArdC
MSTAESRIDPYQSVTNLIIEHLERGVVPWRCPWKREVGIPRNFHTGKTYNGVNVLLLGLRHRPTPYWLTFRQAQELGGYVRKGEHGAHIIKVGKSKSSSESEGDEDSTLEAQSRNRSHYLREYTVFNSTQIEGIDFPASSSIPTLPHKERIAAAEQVVAEMQLRPAIQEGMSTQACYRMSSDPVQIPALASFESAETYYLTLFHELTHATGHPSRLNRESPHRARCSRAVRCLPAKLAVRSTVKRQQAVDRFCCCAGQQGSKFHPEPVLLVGCERDGIDSLILEASPHPGEASFVLE